MADSTPKRNPSSPKKPKKTATPVKQPKRTLRITMLSLLKKVAGATVAMGTAYIWGACGFSYAWLLLGVSAWAAQQYRSEERRNRLALGRALGRDEKAAVRARLEDLPSWVFFPDMERAEWLNKAIKQFWPYFGDFLHDLLKETVEPKIRESLPSYLQSFRFEKIVTGDLPPRVGGVKVYTQNIARNEVVMDIELMYSGDCHFQICAKNVRAGIKDLQLHGIMRVILKPLCKKMPLFGGMNFFFLNPPLLDFNLTKMADFLDIPGLSEMLHKAVIDNLCTWIVLPNKFPIVLSDDVSYQNLKFSVPSGVMRINIVAGKALTKADVGVLGMGKSDPYTILSVGAQEFKTPYINNTINPKWHYYCEAIVDQLEGQAMTIEVMDHDQGNKDDFLGRATVPIYPVAVRGAADTWITLEQVETGQLNLHTQWLELSDDADDLPLAEDAVKKIITKANLSTALLLVYADSAQNLPGSSPGSSMQQSFKRFMHNHGSHNKPPPDPRASALEAPKSIVEPSPCLVLTIGNQKHQTRVCHKTNNPVWEESYHYFLRHPETKELQVDVMDSKTEKSLGKTSIALSRLLAEPSLSLEQPFALRASGNMSKVTLSLKLKILKPAQAPQTKATLIDDDELDGMTMEPLDVPSELEVEKIKPSTPIQTPDSGISKDGVSETSKLLSNQSPSSKRSEKMTEAPKTTTNSNSSASSSPKNNMSLPLSPSKSSTIPSMEEMVHGTVSPIMEAADLNTEVLNELNEAETDYGRVQLTLRHSAQRNKLVVVVHKAVNLPREDNDLPDPYVKLYLLPDKSKDGKQKTQICKNSCNPVFDETFEFEVTKNSLASHSLDVIVGSKSGAVFARGKVLGKVTVSLAEMDLSKAITEWYSLESENSNSY